MEGKENFPKAIDIGEISVRITKIFITGGVFIWGFRNCTAAVLSARG